MGSCRPALRRLELAILLRAAPREARRELIEENVDDRRRKQRQHLTEQQTADHGHTERLTQLRADAGTERQRQTAQQRRQSRHQDRPEAQQRSLIDSLSRLLVLLALQLERKVNHHDAVLLHDADQKNDADDTDDIQIQSEQAQGQERTDTRRRQRGQDRQRMNEALIKDTQNDVHSDERRQNQQPFV